MTYPVRPGKAVSDRMLFTAGQELFEQSEFLLPGGSLKAAGLRPAFPAGQDRNKKLPLCADTEGCRVWRRPEGEMQGTLCVTPVADGCA